MLGDSAIDALQVLGDTLCVGGVVSEGSIGVACWEGDAWVSRTKNMTFGQVHALELAGGELYAGGTFALEGIDTGGGLAKWTGKGWELIGGGLVGEFGQPDVRAIAVDGAKVYATGFFAFAGGAFVRNIAMFNGSKWNDLNGGLQKFMGVDIIESPRGSALAVDDGGELYVGGRLTFAGDRNALRVARWDGADWQPVDDPQAPRLGLNGFLNTVCAASDGSVYAGGGFEHLGGDTLALGVARFVPAEGRWYPLGAGLTDVATLVEHEGEVYAGGAFVSSGSAAGTSSVKGVGRWDGATWRSMGGGVVGKVAELFSGRDGLLYAGGNFTAAGAAEAKNVAVWDGSAWSAVGSIGDGEQYGDVVRAFAYDAEGALYAGGDFTVASGIPASNIVRWDDDAWVPVGDGVDGAVDSMALYDGKLVIGGAFSHSGNADVPHVAFWDPESETFQPLGGGLPAPDEVTPVLIQAMAVHGKDLYVAGLIEMIGGLKASHVARFDGKKWHDVDGGVDDVAESLSLGQGALWIGGTFTRAGGYGSIAIGRYGLTP